MPVILTAADPSWFRREFATISSQTARVLAPVPGTGGRNGASMPTYRYRCGECGEEIELWQSFTEEPLLEHEGCGGELRKVLSPAGIVLKGSGFYRNDSRAGAKGNGRGSGGSKESKESKEKESTSSGSDSSTSDSKGDSSKDSKGDSKSSTGDSKSTSGSSSKSSD